MIMEKSVSAVLIPMAVSLVRIIFATFIILIGVPVSAIILERAQAFADRLSERETPSEFSAERRYRYPNTRERAQ